MLYGLSITCFDRFLSCIFSHFVRTRMGCWDRYLQWSLLISRQFPALCRPAGCELCSMASVSPVWTAFWTAFFTSLCRQEWGAGIDTFSGACSFPGSFRPCAGLQGVNYALWPWYHLFGPLFGPHFFTICADSFRPCAALQSVNYAPWPQYHLFGPLFGPHFFTICADKNGGASDRYLQYRLLISRQFRALCRPAGCELCSMASVSPV